MKREICGRSFARMDLVYGKSSVSCIGRHRLCLGSGFKRISRIAVNWRKENGYSLFIPRSKKSPFQDFQRFAEPARLLPATEARFIGKNTAGSVLDSENLNESSSFYLLQIRTSDEFGSSLSDADAAILVSFIDVNGDSLLQRIPALSAVSEELHFQRGSIDVLGFQGPKLRDIAALWIGLESGSWRLSKIKLTVVRAGDSSSDLQQQVRSYNFEEDDLFLGERGGLSMVQLKPQLLDGTSLDAITNDLFQESKKTRVSMEESMEEYSDLKLSLLVYDLLFILIGGAAISAFPGNEEAMYAFATGGGCGFLYLLLLQRSVDGLSSSSLQSKTGEDLAVEGRFRGYLWQLALILVVAGSAARFWVGGGEMTLSPLHLFFGVAGFFNCKLSVILAAVKPLRFLRKRI